MSNIFLDTTFEDKKIELIRASIAKGNRSFWDIVSDLPGVYPPEVAQIVRQYHTTIDFSPSVFPTATNSKLRPFIEHPLDYDWRFTSRTAKMLLDLIPRNDRVVLLGTPTIAIQALEENYQGSIHLFDQNPLIAFGIGNPSSTFDFACVDLLNGDPVETDSAIVSISDPPWYPEHTRAFLWAAARSTRVGGSVLLSLPPEGTRPSVKPERDEILYLADSFGLRLLSIQPSILEYQTPFFESNAFRADDLLTVSPDWRRGDLAKFDVHKKVEIARPHSQAKMESWVEETVGSVRIKCRATVFDGFREPLLVPLLAGDILNSVSCRNTLRTKADVWTSGNRIFQCRCPYLFRVILSAIATRQSVEESVGLVLNRELTTNEKRYVEQATHQAKQLIEQEEKELADYGYTSFNSRLV